MPGIKEDVEPYTPTSILQELPGNLPTAKFKEPADFESIATFCTAVLGSVNSTFFTQDAIWRDLFALTGTTRTIYSPDSIVAAWLDTTASCKLRRFQYVPNSGHVTRLDEETGWVNITLTFETSAAPESLCTAMLSLVPDKSGWKIWLLRTVLEQLIGHGDVDNLKPVQDGMNGSHQDQDLPNGGGENGNGIKADTRNSLESTGASHHYDCVVVGAGQAGLGCSGRLQALDVSYITVEKNAAIGDNWLNRYESARLHTIREYSHLPFDRTYDDSYQQFLTKYDIVKGYRSWVKKYGIAKNIWFSTTLESGTWNPETSLWTLSLRRDGTTVPVTARHVILAIGPGGQIPLMPQLPNRNLYKGDVIHSSEFDTPDPWKGKVGVVVGTANTAHDVAEDMVEAGLSKTYMVQRRRTYVLPAEYLSDLASKSFNSNVPTVHADRDQLSMPNVLGRLLLRKILNGQAEKEPARFQALERAGFKVESHGDLSWHMNVRLGGHYMDVGCSERICKGEVR